MVYVGAILRQRQKEFLIIDCLASDYDLCSLIFRIQDVNPKIVAIRTSTPTLEWDLNVAKEIKNKISSIIIVFWGPHVALFPQKLLSYTFVDEVVVSEPEAVFSVWNEDSKLNPGTWIKKDGLVLKGESVMAIEDLDSLPFPAWDLLPYAKYDALQMLKNKAPFVLVLASRGCPHGCAYCPYPISQGRKRRSRSVQNVIAELEWLVNDLGVKAIFFRDPEFAIDRFWIISLCAEIKVRNLEVVWRCETRIENLDFQLLEVMAAAGCIGINIGIESGDKKNLYAVGRNFVDIDRSRNIIDTCKKKGIETFCFFMIGFPTETYSSAIKTIYYALKLFPDYAQFTIVTPYFGTPMLTEVENSDLQVSTKLTRMTGYNSVMRSSHLASSTIQRIHAVAEFLWNIRKSKRITYDNISKFIIGLKSERQQ